MSDNEEIGMPSKIRTLLFLLVVLSSLMMIPGIPYTSNETNIGGTQSTGTAVPPQDNNTALEDDSSSNMTPNHSNIIVSASDSTSGFADPLSVERRAYYSTGPIVARTDTMENTRQNLTLDTANGWKGSAADVQVTDLTTLYAVNGTFDEGIVGTNIDPNSTIPASFYPYGWGATSNSTDAGQTQRAAYDSARFVVVENEGTKIGPSGKHYTHYAGTSIVWTQTIENMPQVDNFTLSFDYLYLRGVLGTIGFTGNCSLAVFLNGQRMYGVNLPTLASRGVWYGTGEIPIYIPNAPTSFELMIGLVIDQTLALNADADYNGDGLPEGISNTVYITAYIDNLRFVSASPPSFESVNLQFHAGGQTEPITGSSGSGTAQIINSTYWIDAQVPISISANKTVTFTYVPRLLSHRFSNTSYTTDINKQGVSFVVQHGMSTLIQAFTYLGSLVGYEENTLLISHPPDWENITVLNPFLSDISLQCTFNADYFSIPESALSTLGWFEVAFQSPNYAQDIDVQIFDSGWISGSIFRPGNQTRPLISIQNSENVPSTLDNVDISWYVTNGTLWFSESVSGGTGGTILGTSKVIDSSQAGAWQIEIFWSNGTEFAFDATLFAVYHTAELTPIDATIEVSTGEVVLGRVSYRDTDTGLYLMDSASIIGNWSASTIVFNSNPARHWWEADFDTSMLAEGVYKVVVNAAKSYYDFIFTEFYIISTRVTRLSSPNAPWSSAAWDSTTELVFNYEQYNSETSSWEPVLNESDVVATINWTAGYWSVSESATPGIFTIDLNTIGNPAGTYILNVTFSKPYHESKTILLTLIVSPSISSLTVMGNSSARVDIDEDYNLILRYSDLHGDAVLGGLVTFNSSSPSSGLSHSAVEAVSGESGNYSLTLTPHSPAVYTIRFIATGDNAEPASAVFVLLVNDVITNLKIYADTSVEIGLSETYNTTIGYKMLNGTGIENAEIALVYSGPTGYLAWNISETSSGNYSIQFSAGLPSTYVITIIASKQFYQRSSDSFSLIVSNIPTSLLVSVGSNAEMGLTDTFEMTILYEMYNGTGIDDATILVVHSGDPTAISSQVIPNGFGNYSIQFSATLSGSYLITITAAKQYHQGNAESFLLVVREISTTFSSLNGTGALVRFGHDYRLFVSYKNGTGYGLSDANVSIVDKDEGISCGTTQMVTPGVYSILLTPLFSDSFSITVQASLLNYRTQIVFFTLTVTAIPTTLVTLNLSTSIAVDQSCTVYLLYQDEDTNVLENSTLGILNPPSGIDYSPFEELGNGIYRVTLTPLTIATFDIVFSAQKDGYQTDYAGFTLTSTIIPTELRTAGDLPRDTIMYSNQYELLVYYVRTDLNQNISSAGIEIKASPSTGLINSSKYFQGGYHIILNATRIGSWTLTITANKTNYAISSTQFILVVNPLPISAQYIPPVSPIVEGQPFNIKVNLTIHGTNIPIRGAFVSYRIYAAGTSGSGELFTLEESQTPGIYSGAFTFPLYIDTTTYTLEVHVQKDNFALSGGSVSFSLSKNIDSILRWTPVISVSGISIIAIIGLVVGVRVYNTRKRKRNLAALQIKKRFDDVSNILGILVLYKDSGLPIYSKTLRGGFEEAMVSAFITAITNFRSEFGMDEKHWDFNIIPISDIISAVPTRSLIVAFITVRPPSKYQETGMEAFGRAVGAMFDDQYATARSEVMSDEHYRILDNLFYDLLDGFLTESYRISKDVSFPKQMKCLVETAQQIDRTEGFRLEDLAKGMATCGIEESHAYKLVMDAIEDNKLQVVNGHIPDGRISGPFMDRRSVEDDEDE